LDRGGAAQLGGLAALLLLVPLTVRQARRVRVWAYVPAMLGRDPWLGAAVASAALSVTAFAAWLALGATPAVTSSLGPVWTGLAGIAVLGWPALAALRALADTWRGRPLRALDQFARAAAERTARRNAGVTLWILLGRTWTTLVPLVCLALVVQPRAAMAAVVVPYPLLRAYRRGPWREDRWLLAATSLTALGAAGCAAGGALGDVWTYRAGLAALAAVAAVFGARAARAWWRGGPGPWRTSLIMSDLPMGAAPSVELSPEVRQAFRYARSVVLSYAGRDGPRAVGATATVSPSGELRLVAEADGPDGDPRVAVFAVDPLRQRFWVEVRGVAVPGSDVLSVTPTQVSVGRFPGRHQRR
ncbi:hypothetical protein ABZ297_21255, partial [Nonomuraea sp. NPDC005983]